ncbi:hypothetical protein MFERI14815_00588 [Mycoplasma feriruminatoris]|uniref:lipoprotein n=1 Tax=Mycoplasma feriruminatoris TaxID=1179777 RepID=UPI00241CF919|nr:lipoprotein [Mycoplasma feriruminatoris]WFQ91972.1 hypothetical protein MFERI14815_00588 [Mycoplasma feriruminatoris]
MKRLITILGSIWLLAITSIVVVGCKIENGINSKLEKSVESKNGEKGIDKNEIKDLTGNENDKKQGDNYEINHELNKESKNNELMQSDGARIEERYYHKRSKEENFNLIKKSGEELVTKLFSDQEKLDKFRNNTEYKDIWLLISELTSIYSEISNHSSLDDFVKKSTKSIDLENLHIKFDKTYINYENNKDKIWSVLNSFFSK